MTATPFKILVAAPLYPPEIGGPATHTVLIEAELPTRGFLLDVLPFASVRKYPKVIRHVAYAFALLRHARRAQVIYTLDPVSVGLPTYIASRLSGVPYVLRIGGDYAWEQGVQRFGITETLDEYLAQGSSSLFVHVLAKVQSFVARQAHTVVVPSKYLASVAEAWGVLHDRIAVVYSAPEPLPPASREASRETFGISDEIFLIASAARLVPWKGVRALIDAVALMKTTRPDVHLLIAGDGPERAALEAHIASRGLQTSVRLLGRLDRNALAQLLAASDCFALNTRYEGLSHQLLEAFMAGAPVVTTNAGGNAELVEDQASGLIVPFNDVDAWAAALTRLVDEPALRERLRTGGHRRLRDFDTSVAMDAIAATLTNATQRT